MTSHGSPERITCLHPSLRDCDPHLKPASSSTRCAIEATHRLYIKDGVSIRNIEGLGFFSVADVCLSCENFTGVTEAS